MEALGLLAIFVWLFIIVGFVVGPFVVLYQVSDELGRSRQFMWWGLGGWFGAVMGLLWLIAVGRKLSNPESRTPHAGARAPTPSTGPPGGRLFPDTPAAPDESAGAPLTKSQQRKAELDAERERTSR